MASSYVAAVLRTSSGSLPATVVSSVAASGLFQQNIFWKSFVAHTMFVMSICCASVWNASSYYFSHFAVKYEAQVEERVRASKGR